ncbi:quaternary amine ABC transporter ATP-binding protein [Halotalea alkalilenta]|uniref:quaternary amine ABC transporter ATP-binding protein n=1 Tax=Halotalea alkalilenta TaxID=376489 RepID=UPI0009DDA9EA|nr:glycine betaine/L-proline ABC transporter ATP-binding protein [Halotalea alkalilenta]
MSDDPQSQDGVRIRVRKLSKVFGKHPDRALALRDQGLDRAAILERTGDTLGLSNIDFEVRSGELLVIMGLSGSGKSTLIRCLNRLIEPSEGEISIEGDEITRMDAKRLRECRRRHFSMVFQHFALFPHRSVLANAEYALEIRGMPKAQRQEKALDALRRVGLEEWKDAYPRQLSGGMQQRVGLARALASDSSVMLMDEAFSALDPLIRRDMQQELVGLQRELDKTIVFITHDLDEALNIGDRIILLKDGEIVQVGTPEEILTRPANAYVERFVEGVDMSRVLTAQAAMRRPVAPVTLDDTPGEALARMDEGGVDTLYVVDDERRLAGILERGAVVRACAGEAPSLATLIEREVPRVLPEEPLHHLFPMFNKRSYPIAVVDGEGRLRGVVVRGAVLAQLAEVGREAPSPEPVPSLAPLDGPSATGVSS